jgi:hypothetical protein
MFIFKAKEYQSEKSPIFNSQKSTKTTRKLHIMSQLYAAKVCQLFCNTRYYAKSTYRVSQKKVGSQKISNCSNSLNFEAKLNCNTIKPNVPKWRKTCTGLKFDLLDFYGPQSNIHTF